MQHAHEQGVGPARGPRRSLAVQLASALAIASWTNPASAFPGVLIAKDDAARYVHTADIVLLRSDALTVQTVMIDYQGPLSPFALLLVVPADVRVSEVETVKRGILNRLERLSAPRFHAFYEQDPCTSGSAEQDWEQHVRSEERGFLTPEGVPPEDEHYTRSNLLTRPIAPVFKQVEGEFTYHTFNGREVSALAAWLRERGYRTAKVPLNALEPYLRRGSALLLAEVALDRVEITGTERVQLGAVRYVTRTPGDTIPLTLGLHNANGPQDVTLYVLDRGGRVHVENYPELTPPTNIFVEPTASERLSETYNALFDHLLARTPLAWVTEFAWTTRGCGLPCPDAPLDLAELMTLGADVVERTLPTKTPAVAPESELDRKRVDARIALLGPERRASARRDYERDRRELARRKALLERHTYVLSRMHRRFDSSGLPADVELGRAPALRGGVGVPQGPAGALEHRAAEAERNELQVRFTALHRWQGPLPCTERFPFRWGKRWPSEARASRKVSLATDLPRAPRSAGSLRDVRAPRLDGLEHSAPTPPPRVVPPPVRAQRAPSPFEQKGLCVFAPPADPDVGWWLFASLAGVLARRRRRGRG